MYSGLLRSNINLEAEENHCPNREVDELGEQKVNLKVSQINKRVI